MNKNDILNLLRSKNTVFTFKDIALLWNETDKRLVQQKVYRYVKAGKLHPIRRGVYGKDKSYDPYELATKIYTPAYLSFETVLRNEGMIFQHYKTLFVASYLSREIKCEGQAFAYKKLKDAILINPLGLIKKENYTIASKERAFMDTLYLVKNYHFDNLRSMDWETCFKLLPLYETKSLAKTLNTYYNDAQKS